MRQLVKAVVTVFSVIFLLVVLGLGFLAFWLRVDPNLHGMLALLAGVLALGIHIRGGSGLDFLAVVLLVAALGLGIMVSGGGIGFRAASVGCHFRSGCFHLHADSESPCRSEITGFVPKRSRQ